MLSSPESSVLRRFARHLISPLVLQLVLWVLLTGFYLAWYNRPNYHFDGPIWSLVLLRLVFAVAMFNGLVYLLIPRWLLRGRLWLVLAGAVTLLYGYGLFNYYGYQLTEAFLNPPPRLARFYHDATQPGLQATIFSATGLMNMVFNLQIDMAFPLVVSFLAYAQVVDRRRLALERDQLALELRYRKAQINPQFLFATLGSLHDFTRRQDPRAPDLVLHLADLMRYTLYESDTETVLLSQDMEFLADYVALQRLHARPSLTIAHTVTGAATTQRIVPLLLYPFLERLFVQLDAATTAEITISVELHVTDSELTAVFTRQGSTAHAYQTDAAVLAALRRLELHYPGRHRTQFNEDVASLRQEIHLSL